MRLWAPKPIKPFTTVAPASPRRRASRTIASYSGFPCQRSASPTKMRSNFPSAGNDITCPQSDNPGSHLAGDVEAGPQELTIAEQFEGFEREGRERREAAEHADEEKCTRIGPQQEPLLREPDDDPEYDAAEKVDGKCTEREQRNCKAMHERGQNEAGNRADGATNADEQKSHV